MAFIDVFTQEHKQRVIYGIARDADAYKLMCIVFLLNRVTATLTRHKLIGLFHKYNKGNDDYTYIGYMPAGTPGVAPPADVDATLLVWDEDIGAPEWVFTAYVTGGNTMVVNTADPQNGANNIETTGLSGFDTMRFVYTQSFALGVKSITFWIKLKTAFTSTGSINVYLKTEEHVTVSIARTKTGEHGFDGDSLVYQMITIPIESFSVDTPFDRIWIQVTDDNCTGYFFDNLNIKYIE